MYRIVCNCFSETGPRDRNEDFIAFDEAKSVFVVCDGMGGHDGGDIASRTVAHTVAGEWPGDVNDICRKAAVALDAAAPDMEAGTTMAMAAVNGSEVILAHCGDTRIYLVRNGRIVYQSVDHVALTGAGNPVITRGFFSHRNRYAPDIQTMPVFPGDRILICTDGVYGNGKWSRLRDLLTDDATDCEKIRKLAAENAHDNYSAILLEIGQ